MQKMTGLVGANVGRRLMIGCLSLLIGVPIVGCCLVLLFTMVFPALDQIAVNGGGDNSIYLIVAVVLIVIGGMIGLPLAALVMITLWRARQLDAIFKPFGFSGSAYMLSGRQYHGTFGGREVDVYIYRGPTVEFRIKTNVKTRVQIMERGSLPTITANLFNKEPLSPTHPMLEQFSIFAVDENWTQHLLMDPQVPQAIHTLMTAGASWSVFRHLEVQPGEILLFLNRSNKMFLNSVELSQSEAYLLNLQALTQIIENQPEPEIVCEPVVSIIRESRNKSNKFLIYAIVFVVLIMPLCMISIGVIAFFIASLN